MELSIKNTTDFCTHGSTKKPFTIIVLGKECSFSESQWCPDCLSEYLNKYSIMCGHCGQPIYPGEPVEETGTGYLHISCGNSAGNYAGTWGEGKLIPHPVLARATEEIAIKERNKKIQ